MNVPELALNYEELYAKWKTIVLEIRLGLKKLSSQTNGDEEQREIRIWGRVKFGGNRLKSIMLSICIMKATPVETVVQCNFIVIGLG